MPVVVGAIIAAVGTVATVVGAIVTTIFGVVSTIITAIVTNVFALVGNIKAFLGTHLASIMSPLKSVADILLSPLLTQSTITGSQLLLSVAGIREGLSGGMMDIQQAITWRTRPILNPIVGTLKTIKDYVGGVENIITDDLAPVKEIADIIRSVSTIKMSSTLLAGTQGILDAIAPIQGKKWRFITGAVTATWRETVEAVTGLATITDDYFKLLRHEIDTVDERLTGEAETALASITEQVDTTIKSVEDGFSLRMIPVETQLAQVTTRLENVPEFQKMLIKALA